MWNYELYLNFQQAASKCGLDMEYNGVERAQVVFPSHVKLYAYCWLPTNKWDFVNEAVEKCLTTQSKQQGMEMNYMLGRLCSNIRDFHLEFGSASSFNDNHLLLDEYLMTQSSQAKTMADIVSLFELMMNAEQLNKELVSYAITRDNEE